MTDFSRAEAETLTRILRWRRDVRHFRTDPIDPAVMGRLRAAMDMAPSVGNARPWRVVRIIDPALRARLRDNFQRANAAAAASYQGDRRAAYDGLKLAGLDAAPEVLAVLTQIDPVAGHRLGRATMPETLHQSTAMAIHTLWLAARAENLGLGMVSVLNPDEVTALLDVPADWQFSALLCLGHPAFTDDTPLLHRAGWQENTSADWLER
ncbi:5,6-dimethylbenzimidazole synthase [Paracoccus sp. p3-h83]|uniref:5,6-dimethylbenzimidazole synthase n=1 Tax=Paracoccus sp. p3-h83 TaxID=3342805 RepID=UPI0035B80785